MLLELLLGQGFINPSLEELFKNCAIKLMLRWPLISNKFIPMLKNVLISNHENNVKKEKKTIALEILAGTEPTIFLHESEESPLSLLQVLNYATPSSDMWYKIAVSIFIST